MADEQASADRKEAATPAQAKPTGGLTDEGRKAIAAAQAALRPQPTFVSVDPTPDDDAAPDVGPDAGGADPGDETPDAAHAAPDDVFSKIPERALKAARGVWSDETIRDLYEADPDAFVRKASKVADADAFVHQRMSTLPPKGKQDGAAEPEAKKPEPKHVLPTVEELTKEYEEDFGLDPEAAKRRAERERKRLAPIYEEANRVAEREREAEQSNQQASQQRLIAALEDQAERTFGAVDPEGGFYGKGASNAVQGEHRQRRAEMAQLTKLLLDGLRANGADANDPRVLERAAQFADQAIRFPHLQSTERQAVRRQVERRQSQRSIPPGAAANGTRTTRKVALGNSGVQIPEDDYRALGAKLDAIRSRA